MGASPASLRVATTVRTTVWEGVLVALLGLSDCRAPTAAPPRARPALRISTGAPGGGFRPLGAALADAYRTGDPGFDVVVEESDGSVSNVSAIQQGRADLGLAFADVAYAAFAGQLKGGRGRFDRLRGVAVLERLPLHVVVGADRRIRGIGDLRNRRVGVGPPGSGTALTAELVMLGFGLERGSVRVETVSYDIGAERVGAHSLDALFVVAGYPLDSVTASARAGGRLLPLDRATVDRLRHDFPFFKLDVIPGRTYPGQPLDTPTIGVDNVLLCSSALDEATVYELTRRLFDVLSDLAAHEPMLRLMDLEGAPVTPIPLHEGAARYYRERELRP